MTWYERGLETSPAEMVKVWCCDSAGRSQAVRGILPGQTTLSTTVSMRWPLPQSVSASLEEQRAHTQRVQITSQESLCSQLLGSQHNSSYLKSVTEESPGLLGLRSWGIKRRRRDARAQCIVLGRNSVCRVSLAGAAAGLRGFGEAAGRVRSRRTLNGLLSRGWVRGGSWPGARVCRSLSPSRRGSRVLQRSSLAACCLGPGTASTTPPPPVNQP